MSNVYEIFFILTHVCFNERYLYVIINVSETKAEPVGRLGYVQVLMQHLLLSERADRSGQGTAQLCSMLLFYFPHIETMTRGRCFTWTFKKEQKVLPSPSELLHDLTCVSFNDFTFEFLPVKYLKRGTLKS